MITRRGTTLILVAGVAALMATLSLAFLSRMRSDQEESAIFMREIQARVMLTAALQYVAEGARLGWDREAFGWVDIRDGTAGPKDIEGRSLIGDPSAFPAIGGRAARCEMHVPARPPFALQLEWRTNPIPTDDLSRPWSELIAYDETAAEPSPKPLRASPTEDYAGWSRGDPRPRVESVGMSWFRVYRPSASRPAVFILACGAGATRGWRSWGEMPADEQAVFGSQALFDQLRAAECVIWYEAEWSSAVGANMLNRTFYKGTEVWELNNLGFPFSGYRQPDGSVLWGTESQNSRQFAGSFLYVQRRFSEPDDW